MRSTAEIIIAIKDCEEVEIEELKMACLVQDALLFFAHGNIKRLLKGGIGAELTKKDFPDAHADLGISKHEYEAMKKDPIEYLTVEHIPGTPEYNARHELSKRIFKKFIETEGSEDG